MTDHPYPQMLQRICDAVDEYRNNQRSIESLQSLLLDGADTITTPEVRADRRFLQHIEGKLELLRFTTDGDEFEEEVEAVLKQIEDRFCPPEEVEVDFDLDDELS